MSKRIIGITAQRDKQGQFYNERPFFDSDESEEMTDTEKRACDDFAKWLCQMFIQSQENS